nr:hypothetical protein [uncultured Desulfobulbus sp.]
MGVWPRFVLSVQVFLLFLASPLWAEQAPHIWSWVLENEPLYVYRYNLDNLNWRQIREERSQRSEIQEKPKHLILLQNGATELLSPKSGENRPIPAGTVLIKDPDGKTQTVALSPSSSELVLPENQELNGRYLVGAHFSVSQTNTGGTSQDIHLYPKTIVGHYKSGGRPGSFPAFFFDDPRIALEIGSARNPARYRMGGSYQRPHETYDMEVRFKGSPLANTSVEVYAQGSKWHRAYQTDASGQFQVTPFDDRSQDLHYEKLLYVVQFEDAKTQDLHVATLPMIIFRNRPEWTSHLWGYSFWAIAGLLGTALIVVASLFRHQRRRAQALVCFEQCRVKED